MSSQKIAEVLHSLYPGVGFSFIGDDLSTLVCEDKNIKLIPIDQLQTMIDAYVLSKTLEQRVSAIEIKTANL